MIFGDFAKALSQIGDPRFRRVFLLGVGLTLVLLIGAYAALLWLVQWATPEVIEIPFVGQVTWIGSLLSAGSFIFMMLLSVVLMIPVASVITSLFLDDVAQAVEDEHYPHLRPARRVTLVEAVRDTGSFFFLLVVANILAIFAYALIPPATPFIFYALNGFLLGREYFQLVAMRRVDRARAQSQRKQYWKEIWVAGILMALPLTIPIANLIIPILGAATFTHLYHRLTTATQQDLTD